MKTLVWVMTGGLLCGAAHAAETLMPDRMIDTFDHFAQQVTRLEQSGQTQLESLKLAYQSASEDQKPEIDTQIGALQLELRDLHAKHQELTKQIEALRHDLPTNEAQP